jgi:hypothetical protein
MADRTGTYYAASDEAIHGYGAELQVGNGGSPETFESIAFIREITPGDMSTADLDCTHLRSPDAHREHRAGIRDSGAWTGSGIYVPTEESISNAGGGLFSLWRGRQNHNFKLVFAEASPSNEVPLRGYISSMQIGTVGLDDIVPFTFGFQPSVAFDQNLP